MTTQPTKADRPRPAARLAAIALAVLTTAGPGAAPPADKPAPSDPVFTALTTDGKTASGRILRFGAKGEVTLVPATGPERVIPLESLVKLSREGLSPSLSPEAMVVLFPDGDRLHRTAIAGANETALEVQPYSLGNLSIPLDSLLGLVFTLPQDAGAAAAAVQRLRTEPRSTEVLWLANNDRINVGFLGLTEKTVDFKAGRKTEKLDRARVVALGFDPALVSYPKPESAFVDLTLADGSRLGVSGPKLEQGHVVATTRFGVKVRAPLPEVLRFHARTPSVVYLSERTPVRERYVPYVGPTRPYRRDTTVDGASFRLGGQEFDRGIGTTSRTLLAYRIEKGDRRFQATVGLDDRAGPLGSVAFRVLIDSREAFASPPMASGDPARPVDVDLTGGNVFILITEFGERGDVRDIADWVEARIIR
jgi:NPCBM/NEW2 domain